MSKKPARTLFGTDGIRGTANAEPMTATTALALAMAAGAYFRRDGYRNRVIIGNAGDRHADPVAARRYGRDDFRQPQSIPG